MFVIRSWNPSLYFFNDDSLFVAEKKQTLFADLAHQHAEMPIRAIQHGRHTEAPGGFPIGVEWGIHSSMLPRFLPLSL